MGTGVLWDFLLFPIKKKLENNLSVSNADWPLWQLPRGSFFDNARLYSINVRVFQRLRGFKNTFLVELRLF
jgi:hypothetical protein